MPSSATVKDVLSRFELTVRVLSFYERQAATKIHIKTACIGSKVFTFWFKEIANFVLKAD